MVKRKLFKDKDDWFVIEQDTNQKTEMILAKRTNVENAKALIKKLNSGSGFNGNTPAFFAYRTLPCY